MLSEAEKSALRKYLGWPGRFHQMRPEMEQALLALTPDDEVEVRRELEKLTDETTGIEARLADALDRLQASKVGSIELNPGEIAMLRTMGRQCIGRIAALLGVRVMSNAFSGGRLNNALKYG